LENKLNKIYPAATEHGEIKEIFQDVFLVTGSIVMAPGIQLSRNMIILREGKSLTLVSSVRLNEQGLQAIDALGKVEHVIKLGAYHLGVHNGLDDPFYVQRYKARLWAMPGMQHKQEIQTTDVLAPQAKLPLKDLVMFKFDSSKLPEGLLLIKRAGGILIACDSLQNWVVADKFFSEKAALNMQKSGFIRAANIGPQWYKVCEPQAAEFARVMQLPFSHLLPSHGTPILNTAKQQFAVTFKEMFGL